jgi:hypothetical protein
LGNGAAGQRQYDLFGLFAEAVLVYVQADRQLDSGTWRLVTRLADQIAEDDRDQVKDSNGIWELGSPAPLVDGDIGRWLLLDHALGWIARGGGVDAPSSLEAGQRHESISNSTLLTPAVSEIDCFIVIRPPPGAVVSYASCRGRSTSVTRHWVSIDWPSTRSVWVKVPPLSIGWRGVSCVSTVISRPLRQRMCRCRWASACPACAAHPGIGRRDV